MAPTNKNGLREQRAVPKSPVRPTKLPTGAPPGQQSNPPFDVEPIVAFYIFFACHAFAALFSPIQDCDEVFNYWEPMHYLNHKHGFQTWEYSPDFAIRSWSYIGIHAAIAPLARFLPFVTKPKIAEFYFLRLALAFTCAVCETRLFSKITAAINPRVAILYLLITVSAPGLYHASVALLPSSFAMYFTMLGSAAFMDWRGGLRTAQGIFCFGVGACLGWPFAVALSIPFLSEELFLASFSDMQGRLDLFRRIVDGIVRTLVVLTLQFTIDWFFYKRAALVPFNIVWYNIFSGKGPDLYGTEPWHFYLRNLALNFHVWFLLALLSMPLLLTQQHFRAKGGTKMNYIRGVVFLAPFYLWLMIFTIQPHKEERFMYPAYPVLILNAAIAMHIILANLGSTDQRDLVSRIPVQLRLVAILSFVTAALIFSAFRTIGTMTAYAAPLSIYKPLHHTGMAHHGDFVCLGKEWYRFPSHYHLPEGVRAKWIKSEFSGLLPGEFSEAAQGFGLFPGAWLIPPGMNDDNQEDIGKYTDLKSCSFMVDLQLPSTTLTKLEPSFIDDNKTWEKVDCLPYLDASSTGIWARLGLLPDLPFIPARFKPVWGDYCLLKRRPKQTSDQAHMPNIEKLL